MVSFSSKPSIEDFGLRALLQKVKNVYGQHVKAWLGSHKNGTVLCALVL